MKKRRNERKDSQGTEQGNGMGCRPQKDENNRHGIIPVEPEGSGSDRLDEQKAERRMSDREQLRRLPEGIDQEEGEELGRKDQADEWDDTTEGTARQSGPVR
jgi:hypothetical protein